VRVVICDLFAVHHLEVLEHLPASKFVIAALALEGGPFSVSFQMLFLIGHLVEGLPTSSNRTLEWLLPRVCS